MEDHCGECHFDARAMTTAEVCGQLRLVPGQVRLVLDGVDEAALRRRPDPGVWSAMEYLGHLRDLMAYHRFLIERAVAEDGPVVASVDPDDAVASAGYAGAGLEELLGQFDRRVDRLVTVIDGLADGALDRRLVLGDREIDLRLVTRSALHEGYHHQLDLVRVLGPSRV
jgi:hypothetical protein